MPLRAKVLEVLEQHPRRLDTRLVFPSRDGDHLKADLDEFVWYCAACAEREFADG
ncbi:MAG: hypothetical protein ICV67_03130 [Thermoleophilia bacterium]|nr:hypothetical protein [Thermoleophilia bacterium]